MGGGFYRTRLFELLLKRVFFAIYDLIPFNCKQGNNTSLNRLIERVCNSSDGLIYVNLPEVDHNLIRSTARNGSGRFRYASNKLTSRIILTTGHIWTLVYNYSETNLPNKWQYYRISQFKKGRILWGLILFLPDLY